MARTSRPGTRSARALRRENRLGPIQLLIMEAIARLVNDAYGLAIMDLVNERLGRERAIDPGAVYMTLKRLEARNFIKLKQKVKVAGSPPLKVYMLTPEGKSAQEFAAAEVDALHRALRA